MAIKKQPKQPKQPKQKSEYRIEVEDIFFKEKIKLHPKLLDLLVTIGPLYSVRAEIANAFFTEEHPRCLINTRGASLGLNKEVWLAYTADAYTASNLTYKSPILAFMGDYTAVVFFITRSQFACYLAKRGNIHAFKDATQVSILEDWTGKKPNFGLVDFLFSTIFERNHPSLFAISHYHILGELIELDRKGYYLKPSEDDTGRFDYLKRREDMTKNNYSHDLKRLYKNINDESVYETFDKYRKTEEGKADQREIEEFAEFKLKEFAFEYETTQGENLAEPEFLEEIEPHTPDPLWRLLQQHAEIYPTTSPPLRYEKPAREAIFRTVEYMRNLERRRLDLEGLDDSEIQKELERKFGFIPQLSAIALLHAPSKSNVEQIFPHLLTYTNGLIRKQKEKGHA